MQLCWSLFAFVPLVLGMQLELEALKEKPKVIKKMDLEHAMSTALMILAKIRDGAKPDYEDEAYAALQTCLEKHLAAAEEAAEKASKKHSKAELASAENVEELAVAWNDAKKLVTKLSKLKRALGMALTDISKM